MQYVSVYKSDRSRRDLLGYYDRILQKWPLPFEERILETQSGRTHVLACGQSDGKPLLLFHGTGNNSTMWRNNVSGLGEHFRLYLIDTLNDPGKSEARAEFNPGTDYARWTAEVLDALRLPAAPLVGHSKGGWIALNAAIGIPARVQRVVLLAPAAGISSRLNPGFMRKSLRLGVFPTRGAVQAYLRYMSGPGASVSVGYADYLLKLIRGTTHKMVAHRAFSDDELKAIAAPVLLVFGEHEVCVDYGHVLDRARSCIRNLETQIVAGAGHALQGEKPEAVNKLIADFLCRA